MKRLTKESISWVSILILAFLLTACRMRALEGTVVGINGEPLSGSIVTLEVGTNGGLQQSRKTDDAGKFSFGASLLSAAARFELRRLDTILRKSNAPPMANLCECNSKHTPPFPNSDRSRKQWRQLIVRFRWRGAVWNSASVSATKEGDFSRVLWDLGCPLQSFFSGFGKQGMVS
jgi:hypothetical protein